MTNRGFTLVELLVAMTVMAILGVALARMLVSDSRFVSRQHAMVSARQVTRAALNTMTVELRMVADGGLRAATAESVTVRVPYAFGMACRRSGVFTVGSLIPSDSLMYATAAADGLAWRDDAGDYTFIDGITVTNSTNQALCDADSIRVIAGGRLIEMSPVTTVPSMSLFYLYQTVTYKFAPSSELPGRTALWRKAGAGAYEELVAPFEPGTQFACLVTSDLETESCPPATGLDAVRGVELRLVGASERPAEGTTEPQTFELVTRVPFLNKVG